ncbi:hypothetical protein LWI28_007224 [Acer negundo]|uniref:fructose-bisphosphate aldolase n=1 Tax=Acer negundo TaxID=4023 RepID=A0AAD5I5D3_ACENE|nr:hypothetical protein LWI28_007224 [Acer negundo]
MWAAHSLRMKDICGKRIGLFLPFSCLHFGCNITYEMIKNAAYFGTLGRGMIAADKSTGTIDKRLSSINVENVESNRRALHELIFCTPGAFQYLSGVILYEETLY